ncbi:MAG: flagellar filament capping protein FliD [Pseudomonadota bacterium]
MAISTPGVGSGLDVNSIVSKLMDVEAQPLLTLQKKEISYQSKLSAIGSLTGALSSFQSSLNGVKNVSSFNSLNAIINDNTAASVTASSTSVAGSYALNITQLAQAQKVNSTIFTNVTDVVGTGVLTIQFGTYNSGGNTFTPNTAKASKDITIGNFVNTLSGVRDAINAAGAGVSATIVNDGTGNRLVISSQDTGLANSLKITVADDDLGNTDTSGLSKLAFDPTAIAGSGKNLSETQVAKDATLTVDGLPITSASNTLTSAIQGVTLNLLKTTSSAATVTVASNPSQIFNSLSTFVAGYNNFSKTLSSLTAYNASTKQGGPLLGDPTTLAIESRVRTLLSASSTGSAGFTTLSSVGISFQKDGTLSIDASKAVAAIQSNPAAVGQLFAAVGSSSDSLVSYVAGTSSTAPGTYAVNVTQLATKGTLVGNAVAGLTITAGVDDAVALSIDGISATVTLSAGTYATADDLATQLQTKINATSTFSNKGIKVAVTQTGGALTITSDSYGSNSALTATAGAAATNLFGAAPVRTDGLDVAGTIGGTAATGNGQNLTSTSGDSLGLVTAVLGGSLGARGSITYTTGFAYQLDQLIGQYTSPTGLVTARTTGINTTIKSMQQRESDWSTRLSAIEKRYRAQFSALDTTIAKMNSLSTYLQQQINSFASNNNS